MQAFRCLTHAWIFAVGMVMGIHSLPSSAHASSHKVALLISINQLEMVHSTPEVIFWTRSKFGSLNESLAERFRSEFAGTDLEPVVFSYVDQALLDSVLHSPDYAAVFWISHGANESVFDFSRHDISTAFNEIHPDLKLLSVISCFSESMKARIHELNPKLVIQAFNHPVEPLAGLSEALEAGRKALKLMQKMPRQAGCPVRTGIFLHALRKCDAPGPAISLSSNDRIIGTFGPCDAGESQSMTGYFDLLPEDLAALHSNVFDTSLLDIAVDAGARPIQDVIGGAQPELGHIKLRPVKTQDFSLGRWEEAKLKGGRTLGVDSRLLLYNGPAPREELIQNYRPFRCSSP